MRNEDINQGETSDSKDNTQGEATINSHPKEPIYYTATITAIGDVLAHDSVYQDAAIGNNHYDFTNMFKNVKPYIKNADIAVANSESIIGGQEIGLSSYPRFNSPYELGDALKDTGIDVVNIANNHTLDRGEQAIRNATKHWNELGITYVGASTTKEEAKKIKTITRNNITFAFLGYTYGTNGIPIPEGKDYLVNYIDKEKMKSDIKRAKEISDVVVLNLHTGEEYVREYNQTQEKIAQLASDLGVDIIFSHHPHVLEPVKWYEGVNGNKTFVIHSLGNFLAAQDPLYCRIGAILQLEVTKQVSFDATGKESSNIRISNPQLLPTFIKFDNWSNYEILPMYQLSNNELNNAQIIYNEVKNHMKQYVPNLQFIEQQGVISTSSSQKYFVKNP